MNNSFVMGLFNGELRPEEVFPFPETMTEEQAQNTVMFIDPITRFFEVSFLSRQFLIIYMKIKPFFHPCCYIGILILPLYP